MWIASTLGFFSVVQRPNAEHGTDNYQIRARVRQDLVNLCEAADINPRILANTGTDYPFRIEVNMPALRHIMDTLTSTVDYVNFKDAVKAIPGQAAKLPLYSEIWSILAKLGMSRISPLAAYFGHGQAPERPMGFIHRGKHWRRKKAKKAHQFDMFIDPEERKRREADRIARDLAMDKIREENRELAERLESLEQAIMRRQMEEGE